MLIQKLREKILGVLFPPLCLHCDEKTKNCFKLFCSSCQDLFHLLTPEDRCLCCFSILEDNHKVCLPCKESPLKFQRMAAAFEYAGPPAAFLRYFKYSNRPLLAKELAAFMALQLVRLDWPLPDLIVPTPQSLSHFLQRGYNQSHLLALQLGKLLGRPVENLLCRSSEDFSQSALSKVQRKELSAHSFFWKKKHPIADKTILLVDDVITTGTTLRCCCDRLEEGFPSKIYGLAFCIA